uniref:G-protein coupled receptors family 1 profile domain-containing protein n=1 Tax=Strongyloides stercoralis TaxID=6248 RepID=A0AAF5I1T9_STRER
MILLKFLTILLLFVSVYGSVYDSTIPSDVSKLLRNNTNFISRLPKRGAFRSEMKVFDSNLYTPPVCYSYSTNNGDWNSGQYDSVTCNYNSLDKCVSIVGNIGPSKYIYLGCSAAVLLSEGYDPWAYYIEDGCKNNIVTINGESTLATVCACSYNYCNTERNYLDNGISTLKVSFCLIILIFLSKFI